MSYKELYDFCQGLDIHIGRDTILDKIRELSGQEVRWYMRAMDRTVMRGMFLKFPPGSTHYIAKFFGPNVVAVARGENRCWQRLIIVKEALHVLGPDNKATSTPESFETLLHQIDTPGGQPSPQTLSEYECLYLALALFCPEEIRLQFQKERVEQKLDDLTIATRLRIPQAYVPTLLAPNFKEVIDSII